VSLNEKKREIIQDLNMKLQKKNNNNNNNNKKLQKIV
jgi:hypothetical protein